MAPQDQNNDPYGFITNPENNRRKINFGNTPKQRMVIVGVLIVLLIVVSIVVISVFNRAANAQKQRLSEIAQTQTEIIRISEIGDKESSNIDTLSMAVNTRLTMESDLQETNSLLAKHGVKLKDSTLKLKENEATDTALERAVINNQFDDEFTSIIEKQLQDYGRLIQDAYENGNSAEKQVLQRNYDDLELLL